MLYELTFEGYGYFEALVVDCESPGEAVEAVEALRQFRPWAEGGWAAAWYPAVWRDGKLIQSTTTSALLTIEC